MTPILMNGPAIEPVTLAEAKTWLRVDDSAEDDLISALITSARLVLEAASRTLFIEQTWRLVYDSWPSGGILPIPLAPLRTLDALRVFDANNVAQNVPAADYVLDSAPMAARIYFVAAPPPPARPVAGIEAQLTLGYGASAEDVPAPLRQAIKMLAARWYENRGDAAADATGLPGEITALITPFRRPRLA